ncbi:hypothetical protein [Candidatus Nitrosopumilus sp. SW]|uniref:hypothetical protein n=1 Tax=Candidatus Nitrosopumilus sp. SW TaxID=2508726 RepID=UPI00163AEE4E|nr:hypothetical protein [Candidatus Nitrosopumilus sp. SW]
MGFFPSESFATILPEIIDSDMTIEELFIINHDLIIEKDVTVNILGFLDVKGLESNTTPPDGWAGPIDGNLINHGIIENKGTITVNTEFVNYGTLNNLGTISIACDAVFRNEGTIYGNDILVCDEQFVDATICSQYDDVRLEYSINDGKVLEMCKDSLSPDVIVSVYSEIDNRLTIEIPKKLVYAVDQDCNSQEVIVLIDDEEHFVMVENTPSSRIFTLDLFPGEHVIEFLGTFTLGDDVHQYCGEIYGYDSQFLSPKKQIENGRFSTSVRCNDGLELILKYDDSPACVTLETKQKLIQRGWVENSGTSMFCNHIGL